MSVPNASTRPWPLAAVIAILMLAACGGTTIAPFQPEIRNLTDTFEFQVTNARNVDQNLNYNWKNTGTMANVNQDCSILAGTAQITIRDSQDTLVYARNLGENGTFLTNVGAAGTWKIAVGLSNFDGTINFRAQKHTP